MKEIIHHVRNLNGIPPTRILSLGGEERKPIDPVNPICNPIYSSDDDLKRKDREEKDEYDRWNGLYPDEASGIGVYRKPVGKL